MSPLITSGSTPSRCLHAGEELVAVLGVAGGRGGHEVHLLDWHVGFLDQLRVLLDSAKVRRRASGWNSLVASTPWPSRTISMRRSRSLDRRRAVGFGDQQPDRIRSAVDRGHCRSSQDSVQARPGPERADRPQRLVTERIDSLPAASACADQGMQALDPIRHPAGADARDLRHLAEPLPIGEIGARGRAGTR